MRIRIKAKAGHTVVTVTRRGVTIAIGRRDVQQLLDRLTTNR